MKIYCILFDTVPRHPKIKNILEKKGISFSDHITCSSTVPTLVTMLSGKTPTEMFGVGGIGHSHTYSKLLTEEKTKEWDKNIVLHMLPEDWNIHIHSMPETRGDEITNKVNVSGNTLKKGGFSRTKTSIQINPNGFRLLPDDLCGRAPNMNFHPYNKNDDEDSFINHMQKLPNNENNFILLKYNHYHDASRGKSVVYQGKEVNLEYDEVIDMFVDMIDKIDFDEPDSLFWIFADHGEPHKMSNIMPPPDAWLAWCGIKDNIRNKKVDKKIIGCDDFKNTVLNRIYNKNLPNDILDDLDMSRIYVREDGRGAINADYATTVSAIKAIDENRYIQFVHHSPKAPRRIFSSQISKTIVYDKLEDKIEDVVPDNNSLKKHLLDGPWEWFFRKTNDE